MKKILLISTTLLLLIYLTGCTTGGSFLAQNVTNVELSEPNFNIVAKNLEGHSEAAFLFGVSFPSGSFTNTLALIRVDGTAKIYNDAIQNIWQKYRETYGDPEGKNLVLANIRIDTDILNLLLYTKTDMYITADVVEFKE